MLLSSWRFTGHFFAVSLDHFITDLPKIDHLGKMEVVI